jgi:CheY-like chemotaxis protein
MTQVSSPTRRRALIVEDEILIALGFEQPGVVLMDVNLEGGREGIETARWLREVCETAVVFVTSYNDDATVERIHEQVPGAVSALPMRWQRYEQGDAVNPTGTITLARVAAVRRAPERIRALAILTRLHD